MVVVWIPAQLRDLTGGLERVTLEAETVAEVIDALDNRFPGMAGGCAKAATCARG